MSAPARPRERLEGKVQPWHRDRLAAVYVRQSTAQQVHDHQESTRLQYGLAERAAALGWAPSRVLVIDEDLGHSASGADARPGFQRLVSEVGLDHVGIVLGIEMSRLARSGREWHQLLELCALSGTLLGDPDGIYDPADHNDRLLLGLKGTISEAELHLIKQRMWSGRLAKARRGQLAVPLPAGFVRRPSGEVVLDPDEQVQAVVRLVFDLFERLGTVNAVLCFLADNHIQLGVRLREGPERGELQWRRPSRAGVQNMLRNPAYAGIYAYGRSTVDPRRRQAGRPFTGRVRTAREDWIVFLPGLLPAYISIEQYERNRQRMDANRSRSQSMGAVRDGPALLAGLVVCGRCGKKMTVRYQRGPGGKLHSGLRLLPARRPTTEAASASSSPARAWTGTSPGCCWTRWRPPRWRSRSPRPGRPRPSARRWTGSGGSAWNAPSSPLTGPGASTSSPNRKTAWWHGSWRRTGRPPWPSGSASARSTTASPPARPRMLTAAEREQIRALATDIPAIWHAPTTTSADRKQLIRHLVEQVRIEVLGTSEKVNVEVTWAGGHTTAAQITRPVACLTQLSYYPQLAARARELADAGLHHRADRRPPQRRGLPPAQAHPAFTPTRSPTCCGPSGIQRSRIPARGNRPALAEHEWWLRDLAAHLGMSEITLDSWVRRGWAAGYLHPQARLRSSPRRPRRDRTAPRPAPVPRGQHNRRPWLKNQAAVINTDRGRSQGAMPKSRGYDSTAACSSRPATARGRPR